MMISVNFHEFSKFMVSRVSNIWEFNGNRFRRFLSRTQSMS